MLIILLCLEGLEDELVVLMRVGRCTTVGAMPSKRIAPQTDCPPSGLLPELITLQADCPPSKLPFMPAQDRSSKKWVSKKIELEKVEARKCGGSSFCFYKLRDPQRSTTNVGASPL